MAEVLAPVQVQQSASITMLRPSSDPFQNASSGQSHSQSSRMSRSHPYNAQNASVGYRGTATPISPYAFQSTPQLRLDNRASSAPGASTSSGSHSGQSHASSISTNASSVSSTSRHSYAGDNVSSKDDMSLPAGGSVPPRQNARPVSSVTLTSPVPDLTLTSFPPHTFEPASKPSPNRYRRSQQRQDSNGPSQPAASADTAVPAGAVPQDDVGALRRPGLSVFENGGRPGHVRTTSEDMPTPRQGSFDQAKRYRRRSLGSFEPGTGAPSLASPVSDATATFSQLSISQSSNGFLNVGTSGTARPWSADGNLHNRDATPTPEASGRPSAEKRESYHSSKSSTHKAAPPSSSPLARGETRSRSPLRASDASKRPAYSSPLAKPATGDSEAPSEPLNAKPFMETSLDGPAPVSPAVQQLAALSDKDAKGKKSRLRRAFSFGSAAELRKASAQNAHVERERAKLTKERSEADLQAAEDAAVAAKQEAAGFGNSIYSGQGGIFAGSTDNLSISSTASSASLMLRKMGAGVKKGARSVKGLFRPKSVIGVPAADGPVTEPSVAQVSMVTAEAERERVNVNADPHDRNGGTGFPHLERNSMDAHNATDAAQQPLPVQRKSIIGSDSERDEILKSVRKGILKRTGTANSSGTASPVAGPIIDFSTTEFDLPAVPHVLDSPASSQPGTPTSETGPTKSSSFPSPMNPRPDYFSTQSAPRPFASQSTRSLPNTPGGSRNIAFNPRIQFHDVWSPSEYDRRGDIATCNRLTPMLAQQIKEELNSFKMEMEVHELSKPHTHFF